MLELYEYDALDRIKNKSGGMIAVLDDAAQVRVTKEINSADEISFNYPARSEKAAQIRINRLVACEGQAYRIMKVSRADDEISVECIHIWFADASAEHIETVPDNLGVTPYSLVYSCAQRTAFTALTQSEVQARGMSWIGKGTLLKGSVSSSGKEFAIDFFAADKLNFLDFVKMIIDNAGFGEMYYDNDSFAVVERLGRDTPIRLELSSNMESIRTETDISSLVTRLYPYGYEDLTIGSVYGANYIESPNAAVYGVKESYKDYSDYTDPTDLYYNAAWEFDEANPERIDVPSISVTGSVADLSAASSGGGFAGARLGDTVTVVDEKGTQLRERIIAVTYYPYESTPAELTIGRVKRDLYFYVSQISELAKRYSRCSTNSGKISARAISGSRASSSVDIDPQSPASRGGGMITVSDNGGTRVKIGADDDGYVFKVCDRNGKTAIETSASQPEMAFCGGLVEAPLVKIAFGGGSYEITADEQGVYINGRKIITESTG